LVYVLKEESNSCGDKDVTKQYLTVQKDTKKKITASSSNT